MLEVNRILCPVDFSPFSERALVVATRMAKWYGARLRVLHIMPPMESSESSELASVTRALTTRNLIATVERSRLPGVDISTEVIDSAHPDEAILECANAFDADLIVTGSHGRTGVQRVLLGSVVESLLHKSGRPILTVPSHIDPRRLDHAGSFGLVLCTVDFGATSLAALAMAFSLAEEVDARLTLLHVIEVPPALGHPQSQGFDVDQLRAEAEAQCLTKLRALVPEHARDYCTIETAVVEGNVASQILRVANEQAADLIVLGVHGRSAFDLAFFGSNSKEVIRQAQCPVLVVPASARASLKAAS